MRRSILTGVLSLLLSVGALCVASADPLADTPFAAPPVSTVAEPTEERQAAYDPAPQAARVTDSAAAAAESKPSAESKALPTVRLRRFADGIVNRTSAITKNLTRSAMRFLGTPYVFGGTSRRTGFDCSGYVQHVFALIGLHLPRTADAQFDAGHRIAAAMRPGDLVFFHTYAPGVSHVGIYLGENRFIHSSSSHGVSIARLSDAYWAPRYVGAKRVYGI